MNTATNLTQKIEPSISANEFLLNLSKEDAQMLVHSTLRRILNEIKSIEENEQGKIFFDRPDFAQEVELIQELYSYGYRKEAHECLTNMGRHINELYSNLMPWFRMQARTFSGYVLPTELRFNQTEQLFKREIYLEDYNIANDIVIFTWCWLGTQNNEDVEWNNSAVALFELYEFAENNDMLTGLSDTSDHTGEHIQRELKTPLYIYVQEHIETIIKEYVKAGKEVVSL